METNHNPDRFMSDLRQILSQGRKRIGLLVGAGAPLAIRVDGQGHLSSDGTPLIPGVEQLTEFATAGLTGADALAIQAIKQDIGPNANIEAVLSRVRLFEQALSTTQVNGLNGAGFAALGKTICKRIGEKVGVDLPKGRSAYSELVAWISGTMRSHSVEVFTTNYDLLFDEAFEEAKAPYFDGFAGGSSPFFDPVTVASDDLPARWSRLWKLHGSIGWALENGAVVRGRGKSATELVYPDHLKYDLTQKQPYAALFERLKRFIMTPDTLLLTIGFSFRDAHICAVLEESLAMNKNSAVLAFQFQALANETAACEVAFKRPNLTVYASDGAVIGGIEGTWHPGELPKNWENIRSSFWGPRKGNNSSVFLLGDFVEFSKFCALAQATDLIQQPQQADASLEPVELSEGNAS